MALFSDVVKDCIEKNKADSIDTDRRHNEVLNLIQSLDEKSQETIICSLTKSLRIQEKLNHTSLIMCCLMCEIEILKKIAGTDLPPVYQAIQKLIDKEMEHLGKVDEI